MQISDLRPHIIFWEMVWFYVFLTGAGLALIFAELTKDVMTLDTTGSFIIIALAFTLMTSAMEVLVGVILRLIFGKEYKENKRLYIGIAICPAIVLALAIAIGV